MVQGEPALGEPGTSHDHVLVRQDDAVGRITLNRPRELNALTPAMVGSIRLALGRWRQDPAVRTVVIDGAGQRGLSAGDDVRALYDDVRSSGRRSVAFWAEEYRLCAEMSVYPKPIVALMDGVVMGGGVAISAYASHRVVNDDSVVALPEIAIGLPPHHGGTRLLARAPGEVGTHVALTGDRMDASDAIYCGFADYWVPLGARADLLHALAHIPADEALIRFALDAPQESELAGQRGWIDHCYACDRVEDIVERLRSVGRVDAGAAATRIAELPPTALKVALRALREARSDASLEISLRREYRIAARAVASNDLLTAVRTHLFDRGQPARWQPPTLDQVTVSAVDAHFRPLEPGDLDLHQPPEPGIGSTLV
jgi:enoyl-CoA hydratase